MIIRKTTILLLICLNILSCKVANETREGKASSNLSSTKSSNSEKELMSISTFDVNIKSGAMIKCKGSGIQLRLYSDLSMSFSGSAKCGWLAKLAGKGTIDLSESFKYSNLKEDLNTPDETKMKGIIIRSKNIATDSDGELPIGGYVFTPARPLIVNPLTNLKNLKHMKQEYEENSSVKVKTEDGSIIEDEGVIGVQVFSPINNTVPTGATSIKTLKGNKIIHSKIDVISGFNNIPQRGLFLLFDSREMWIGTAPVAIYKMEIKSRLTDIVEGLSKNVITSLATNGGQKEITITLNLTSFNPVTSDDDDDEDDDEDDDDEDDDDEDDDEDEKD